jgi:hypothetical protein
MNIVLPANDLYKQHTTNIVLLKHQSTYGIMFQDEESERLKNDLKKKREKNS